MSFEQYETSLDSGQPVFLLEFSRPGRTWWYTNTDRDVAYGGNSYVAIPAVEKGIIQEGGAESTEYVVTLPASAAICAYLDAVNTTYTITLLVYKVHLPPGDVGGYSEPAPGTAKLLWAGNLTSVNRLSQNQREMQFATLAASMKTGGLRLGWGRNCPHMLYGRGCNVDRELYAAILDAPVVIDNVTLASDAAAGQPDGWFSGGFIEWQYEAGLIERTAIETHVGNTLYLTGSTQGMQHALDNVVAPFIAYPGCNRTPPECDVKFNNSLNYGGIEYLQGKSPFGGNPIF